MTAQFACLEADLARETALRVELPSAQGPIAVALVRDSTGMVHAVSDRCSHADVSLAEGEVDGCFIECWLHGSAFNLTTGQPTALPATRPIPVYPVTVDGERVLVDVDAPLTF